MLQQIRAVLAGAVFALALTAPGTVLANDEETACLKKVKAAGYPHRIKMVAELNAVRLWSELTAKKGKDYAMWHNARGSDLACNKIPRSEYYRCTATGEPCLPRDIKLQ